MNENFSVRFDNTPKEIETASTASASPRMRTVAGSAVISLFVPLKKP